MKHTSRYERVSVDRITIDPRVQRKEGVNRRRADQIASDWNPDAVGTITISRRSNGTLVCLDGAHRTDAARKIGQAELDAKVHEGLTLAQEAAIFKLLNTFQQPSFISRTLAAVVQGDPDATAVVSTIERHGWRIGLSAEDGIFSAVAAADSVYRTGAGALPRGAYPEVLDQSLSVITGAWRRDRDSAHQMVVQGAGQVIARFAEGVDLARFATVLSRQSPVELMVRARSLRASQGGTTAAALAKVLVSVYNNRLRTNLLPEWVWTR